MQEHSGDDWERFIEAELLQTNLVSGVSLITHQGGCIYTNGNFDAEIPPDTWKQFTTVFQRATSKHDENICNAGFSIPTASQKRHFKVIRKTLCSLYGTSEGGTEGLIVCNLPYGVLVCVHRHPDCAGRVITAVERFADMLRA